MKYRTKTTANLKGFWNRKCSECNDLKPARTHHCSICEECVFQMSHHCLFTNNCVGLDNQRYFLLFILYSLIGATYYAISIVSIWNHYVYKENHQLMSFLLVLDCLLAGALTFYNIWSWFLACIGHTNIEFMGRHTGYKTNNYDFTFSRVRDNLFKIFGTKSFFQMLSPSMRYNAFNGIEWSFQMKDLGFNEFGELADGLGDEENLAGSQLEMKDMSIQNTALTGAANQVHVEDPEGDDEVEDTQIAI
jgi:hypothetical protein